MRLQSIANILAAAVTSASAVPLSLASPQETRQTKPPYFLLTGDSTVAVDGGWGDGFLTFVESPADGKNYGKSGATTVSFRDQGIWDSVIAEVNANKGAFNPIVTIQFGHNDQKAAANISSEQFQANLQTLATEVTAAGGIPVIITSLTRRTFSGGKVIQNLETERLGAIAAAEAVGTTYLDLNTASTNYLNAIGNENGHKYDLSPGDSTHLNTAGGVVFGRLVADLLLEKREDLAEFIRENKALSIKLKNGEFASGDETD
ncbi:GDSL-like Lipase/Acylhydrolase [Colletotrichum graminicola]|uniref:GDSL-like Lipase/Acylhydrolase n=1 Tax=Colletotrichum graminicola (strain M1.001 / M2 / FGSC 10212) TaxID=645133 RepID=E3Q9J0_COLGM|nr:GDSL-like Lipase/Acylhydrolase [Colletotrichum graminicola M1.001]EFQ27369.1 GDSL-like Lipase/Acylhydrolase [Colletotrichum graminicola M1.001]WDK13162.1 GDSL-like Lipase/Acylhydrolase [Colletotrichum graminicola]